MIDKFSSCKSTDVKERITAMSNPSSSLSAQKSDVEFLLHACVANADFVGIMKESKGVLVLATIFKNSKDYELKSKITTLLVFLSLNSHNNVSAENLMNDINISSLINLLSEKDFSVIMQVFGGLKVLMENPQTGISSTAKLSSAVSFDLLSATTFLENITALLDPSSKLLSDAQKVEIIAGFTQLALAGVMARAVEDTAKDSSSALSKNFNLVYGKFLKTLEICHKGDFSVLDAVIAQILQLVKDGKLFAPPDLPGGNLAIINNWLGGSKRFSLLFKASRDGFGASQFHQKCDNKGPTVTIITCSEGNVFGGYAGVSWVSSRSTAIVDDSGQSFLFSLKNPRNAAPAKFGLVDKQNAMWSNSSSFAPAFGGSYDLCCADNSNTNTNSYTSLSGTSYANPTGLNAQSVFTGKYNYMAKEIETYQVQ